MDHLKEMLEEFCGRHYKQGTASGATESVRDEIEERSEGSESEGEEREDNLVGKTKNSTNSDEGRREEELANSPQEQINLSCQTEKEIDQLTVHLYILSSFWLKLAR